MSEEGNGYAPLTRRGSFELSTLEGQKEKSTRSYLKLGLAVAILAVLGMAIYIIGFSGISPLGDEDPVKKYGTPFTPTAAGKQRRKNDPVRNLLISELGVGYDIVRGLSTSQQTVAFRRRTEDNNGRRLAESDINDCFVIKQVNEASISGVTNTYGSASSLAQSDSSDVGVDFKYGMFSGSVGIKNMVQKCFGNSEKQFYVSTKAKYVFHIAHVDKSCMRAGSTAMTNELNKLPDTIGTLSQEDMSKYLTFIQTYGTHYISHVELGGKINRFTYLGTKAATDNSVSQSDIKIAAGASFKVATGGIAIGSGSSTNDAQKWVKETAKFQLNLNGGDATLAVGSTINLTAWVNSIPKNLAVVSHLLDDVVNLLPINSTKRKHFASAVANYLAKCPIDSKGNVCSDHGTCNYDTGKCTCFDGYTKFLCNNSK